MSNAQVRIRLAEGSLRCYALGWLGLVPVLGAPFGFCAVLLFRKLRPLSQGVWNPARRYLIWGFVLALTGLLISGGLGLGINLHLYNEFLEGRF